MKSKLSKSMTEKEFDNGYWYAEDLKKFASRLGLVPSGKLRKDELEKAIKQFLRTGKIKNPSKRTHTKIGIKDLDKGLSLKLPVMRYTSNRETKSFIVKEAHKIVPDLKRKSGARYLLNRWREDQIRRGTGITYGDLVKKYVELNLVEGRFAPIPTARYINFLSDYLAAEKNATRGQAIRAWKNLKKLDIPKTYKDWKRYAKSSRGGAAAI